MAPGGFSVKEKPVDRLRLETVLKRLPAVLALEHQGFPAISHRKTDKLIRKGDGRAPLWNSSPAP
ncbi:hypothetical protein PDR5_54320 [Pseudomonas sp. DR 5-09]|nr:hypothetical protein PDR5_54320 [Pseudomonas sp. DR 5-09]